MAAELCFLKPIPGFNGYFATDTGLIFSSKSGEYKEMKSIIQNGYKRVSLMEKNPLTGKSRTKRVFVHRLVCMAWLSNPENLPIVNHKDGDKDNVNLNNLEWTSHSLNCKHSREQLGNKNYSRKVIQADLNGKFIAEFESMAEAQKVTGIEYRAISKVCSGRLRQTRGGLWFYKENYIEGASKMRKSTEKKTIDAETKNWRTLSLYPGYKISPYGEIYSLHLKRKLSILENGAGYKFVKVIDSDGNRVEIRVHRLVAMAYISNPNNFQIVNHIDGNPPNNYYKNLEWCTQQQNTIHAINTDLRPTKKVVQMKNGKVIKIMKNARTASEETGISLGSIRRNLSGKTKICRGYQWKYLIE